MNQPDYNRLLCFPNCLVLSPTDLSLRCMHRRMDGPAEVCVKSGVAVPDQEAQSDERFLTTQAVAKKFGVSTWTVRNWLNYGVDLEGSSFKLTATKLNGRHRIPESQIRELANKMYGDTR